MDTNEHCYSIGQFASFGRVSVRMLRHYDAIGLLRPHRVDPSSGYRWYHPRQFARLARIVGLREQGFGLDQIATILDDATPARVVRAMFARRAQELRAALERDGRVLESLERAVRDHEGDGMSTGTQDGVRITSIDPVRVYAARATAGGFGPQFIGPVVGPLFDRLADDLQAAGIPAELPAISWYVALDDEQGGVQVNASFSAGPDTPLGPVEGQAFEVVELPAVEQAAVISHVGPPDTIGEAWMALTAWMPAHGYAPAGPGREVYLSPTSVPIDEWVTELHYPVTRAEG